MDIDPKTGDSEARRFLRIAIGLGATGVILGAFGAHALSGALTPSMLSVYETAVWYHFVHALAIMGAVAAWDRFPRPTLRRWGCGCFTLGVVVFSGSLYALAVTQVRWLGAITPLGGTLFIAGWICLFLATRSPTSKP